MASRKILLLLFVLMLVIAPYLGMLYSPSIPFKPNFPAITPLAARQQAFITFMIPKINYANAQILATREEIENLVQLWGQNKELSYSQRTWLHEIADVYKMPKFDISNPQDVAELLSRVDEVPSSLVLAQAANESGWGTSRFAVSADNFFGQHCNVPGCGVLPLNRPYGSTFEVQKFKNVQSAINDYIYNLDTNQSYAEFRAMRAQMRASNEPLVGFRLAPFLVNYSILGTRYALMISSIIINHNLMQYDALEDNILE